MKSTSTIPDCHITFFLFFESKVSVHKEIPKYYYAGSNKLGNIEILLACMMYKIYDTSINTKPYEGDYKED